MAAEEISAKAGVVAGENDTIYYIKYNVIPNKWYQSLTSDEQIVEWATISRLTRVVKLYVYHAYQGTSLG